MDDVSFSPSSITTTLSLSAAFSARSRRWAGKGFARFSLAKRQATNAQMGYAVFDRGL
jgi:hypothetical protein